jgi:hypothetical protein
VTHHRWTGHRIDAPPDQPLVGTGQAPMDKLPTIEALLATSVRPLSEAPTVSSDRTMFCNLAVRAFEGSVAFGSPGDTEVLVTYNDLSTMKRVQLRSILNDCRHANEERQWLGQQFAGEFSE